MINPVAGVTHVIEGVPSHGDTRRVTAPCQHPLALGHSLLQYDYIDFGSLLNIDPVDPDNLLRVEPLR